MHLSPKQAYAMMLELRRREADRAARLRPIDIANDFAQQLAFISDPSPFLAAQCSRRAGKTNALGLKYIKTMERWPKSTSIYLALTRDSAKEIMWPVLQEINDKYKLGLEFTESKLLVTHPNGARLRLLGADMKNFVKRLKGVKAPAIAIDEAQDFGSHLQSLIDDVLTPMLTDYQPDAWLALTGTPGPIPMGYFYEVTHQGLHGYAVHKWTLLDNPFLPSASEFLETLITKRQWKPDHPTLLREWRNQWVLDLQSLWVRYNQELCDFQSLPDGNWYYILGIDVGFKDADALAVIAYSDSSPDTYLVEEKITTKQGLKELVDQIKALNETYRFTKMLIDEGGLGKKLAEEMRKRHSVPVVAADKAHKQSTVEFLNDAMRLGKFKSRSTSRFVQDSYRVQIDWEKSRPDKITLKTGVHSDIIDAVLYAFKESPAYSYVQPEKPVVYGSPEWLAAQTRDLFEKAQEHFQKEQEFEQIRQQYEEK